MNSIAFQNSTQRTYRSFAIQIVDEKLPLEYI
jgi:hypothetical protein